jgi:CBS domain-containing protein
MKVKEIIAKIGKREIPIIGEREIIEAVVQKMCDYPYTRLVYVVDEAGKLTGIISLGMLVRHLFPHGFEPAIYSRFILPMITSETAKDIMNRWVVRATEEDDVEEVIERMTKARVKEIAVVNEENKIIGDITMSDLLKYYPLSLLQNLTNKRILFS